MIRFYQVRPKQQIQDTDNKGGKKSRIKQLIHKFSGVSQKFHLNSHMMCPVEVEQRCIFSPSCYWGFFLAFKTCSEEGTIGKIISQCYIRDFSFCILVFGRNDRYLIHNVKFQMVCLLLIPALIGMHQQKSGGTGQMKKERHF